jgi:hypothetical protein
LIWPLGIALVGVALLLDNFLLLGDFKMTNLWPLLLVLVGAQMLLRGDFVPSSDSSTFGITRGSVESGTLEISAGAIDVEIRALQREGRLIAGQYAPLSRPYLNLAGNHAYLRMDRSATPWLAFADWQMGLARDLPWQLLVSTHLGQINLDLSPLIIQDAVLATGIGDIRLVCPQETLDAIYVRSTLGSIHLLTPPGYRAQITVNGSRMFRLHIDETRYAEPEQGVFIARDPADEAPAVMIYLSGTFGDAYLA